MKSDLLSEAIVDAEALKEAALKSAQEAILEKYAPQVKKAIQIILEQEVGPDMGEDEDPLAGLETDSIPDLGNGGGDMTNPAIEDEVGPELSDSVAKVPLAATESDKLCACPDEEEEIEINFDELERQMQTNASEENIPDSLPMENDSEDEDINLKLTETEGKSYRTEKDPKTGKTIVHEVPPAPKPDPKLNEFENDLKEFELDEELLNSINLESITQYRDFINQLRPILLGDSGF